MIVTKGLRIGLSVWMSIWFATQVFSQLSDPERAGLSDALEIGNLTLADLQTLNSSPSSAFELSLLNSITSDPLPKTDELMSVHLDVRTQPLSGVIERSFHLLFGSKPSAIPVDGLAATVAPGLPSDLERLVVDLTNWILATNKEIKSATAALSSEERRQLLEGLPTLAAEDPRIKFGFVRDEIVGRDTLLSLIKKVDVERICAAGAALEAAVARAMPNLRKVQEDVPEMVKLKIGGIPVVIAGRQNDTHTDTDALLTIDLGGDDIYRGRHGAGVGYASVLIDLGGSDRYEVSDLSVGAGLIGVGIARDTGGDDLFRGASLCFGAGVAGLGILAKEGGDDRYDLISMGQGFGFFGIGALVDSGGSDRYELKIWGQGSARTMGLGWLVDRSGDDLYLAAGLEGPSSLSKIGNSFSQGFGSGFMYGLSGGIGLITDLGGNDIYRCGLGGQASSRHGGIGSLLDLFGDDTYSASQHAQSYARERSVAMLFDLSGSDVYAVRSGSCHGLAHDRSYAFLLDREGDDLYSAQVSNPGAGSAGGVGVFVDASGDDRYIGPPGVGFSSETGSVGVFVDLGGQDIYSKGLEDGDASAPTLGGVAYDVDLAKSSVLRVDETATPVVAGSKPLAAPDQLEKLYDKAMRSNDSDEWVAMGLPALEWLFKNKTNPYSSTAQWLMSRIVDSAGAPARDLIVKYLQRATDAQARTLLRVVADAQIHDASAILHGFLGKESVRLEAVLAAEAVGKEELVSLLAPLAASRDKAVALHSMLALARIGSEQAFSTADALLASPIVMIRKAAQKLVAKFPLRALDAAKRLASSAEERDARAGIEMLGALGTPEALEEIGRHLLDPSPGVRIQSLMALKDRCPHAYRGDFLLLRTDPVPNVRAVARRLEPGR